MNITEEQINERLRIRDKNIYKKIDTIDDKIESNYKNINQQLMFKEDKNTFRWLAAGAVGILIMFVGGIFTQIWNLNNNIAINNEKFQAKLTSSNAKIYEKINGLSLKIVELDAKLNAQMDRLEGIK